MLHQFILKSYIGDQYGTQFFKEKIFPCIQCLDIIDGSLFSNKNKQTLAEE